MRKGRDGEEKKKEAAQNGGTTKSKKGGLNQGFTKPFWLPFFYYLLKRPDFWILWEHLADN